MLRIVPAATRCPRPYADLPVRASQSSASICRTFCDGSREREQVISPGDVHVPTGSDGLWGSGSERDGTVFKDRVKRQLRLGTVSTAGSHGSQPVQEGWRGRGGSMETRAFARKSLAGY